MSHKRQRKKVNIPGWARWYTYDSDTGDLYFCDNLGESTTNHTWFPISDLLVPKALRQMRDNPGWRAEESDTPPSAYHIRNPGGKWLDFYDLYDALREGKTHQIGDTALEHAFKKMMNPGGRSGGKDRLRDLKDMRWSIDRAIEQHEQAAKSASQTINEKV